MADEERAAADKAGKDVDKQELPEHWKQAQTAIWLIGLAILAWRGWWWPGILILVAISGLAQGLIHWYVDRQEANRQVMRQAELAQQRRGDWLPRKCPNCGAPTSVETVRWTGANTADCSYCSTHLRAAQSV